MPPRLGETTQVGGRGWVRALAVAVALAGAAQMYDALGSQLLSRFAGTIPIDLAWGIASLIACVLVWSPWPRRADDRVAVEAAGVGLIDLLLGVYVLAVHDQMGWAGTLIVTLTLSTWIACISLRSARLLWRRGIAKRRAAGRAP